MARAKMDRLVARALEVANDKWARKGTDKQTQIVISILRISRIVCSLDMHFALVCSKSCTHTLVKF